MRAAIFTAHSPDQRVFPGSRIRVIIASGLNVKACETIRAASSGRIRKQGACRGFSRLRAAGLPAICAAGSAG